METLGKLEAAALAEHTVAIRHVADTDRDDIVRNAARALGVELGWYKELTVAQWPTTYRTRPESR